MGEPGPVKQSASAHLTDEQLIAIIQASDEQFAREIREGVGLVFRRLGEQPELALMSDEQAEVRNEENNSNGERRRMGRSGEAGGPSS